jgi:NAD(P)-dependent dehydrogenase (short-subunit alcohol dehydrogenase family)
MAFEAKTAPLNSLHDLSDRVAVITGAGSGIGRAATLRLHEAGAAVLCLDLDEGAAAKTVDELTATGSDRALAMRADVLEPADLVAAADGAVEHFGRLDILVNSAGIFPPAPMLEMTPAQWDAVLGINVKGGFFAAQACAPRMQANGGGAIVNIASKSAYQPARGLPHYAASKGAVVQLTRALALELAPLGIRVNAVAPGGVETDGAKRTGEAFVAMGPEYTRKTTGYERRLMGRNATADEIARVILFLATDWSSYMTGETVLADGGYLLT